MVTVADVIAGTIVGTIATPCVARHSRTALHVHAKRGNGQPIRESLAGLHRANPKEIPECGYFLISC